MSDETNEGLGRRDLLKRGALVGGALVWTVPAVQTLAGPAFAAGSPAFNAACTARFQASVTIGGTTTTSCTSILVADLACCLALVPLITGAATITQVTSALTTLAVCAQTATQQITVPGACPLA